MTMNDKGIREGAFAVSRYERTRSVGADEDVEIKYSPMKFHQVKVEISLGISFFTDIHLIWLTFATFAVE